MPKRPFQNIWGKPKIHKSAKIAAFVDIGHGVKIGKSCVIQAFVSIPPGVELEDDVFVGPHASFANDRHPRARGDWMLQKTLVKKGASIGMHASIGAGVTIGENAMIGQHANVLSDVPVGETWVGNPARPIERRKQ